MRIDLDEEPELKSVRFIKGLSPSIASKVDLQPYLSFDDERHLAIRSDLRSKSFHTSLTKAPPLILKVKPHPHKSRLLTWVKELLVSHPKG